MAIRSTLQMQARLPVAAPIQTETPGAPITYAEGLVIGKMIGANINYTRNSDPLYADDTMAENDNSIVGGTISINVDDLSDEALVAVTGLVEGTAGSGGRTPAEYRETGDASPYVGVGYLRVEGAFYCLIALLFLLYGFWRAVERPGMSVVLTVISLGLRVVLAYGLSAIPALGAAGIWVSIPIGWAVADLAGCLPMVRWLRRAGNR